MAPGFSNSTMADLEACASLYCYVLVQCEVSCRIEGLSLCSHRKAVALAEAEPDGAGLEALVLCFCL